MTGTETPDPDAARPPSSTATPRAGPTGLPLVPASQPLIEAFLATTSRAPDEVIGELEQVGRDCTVYLAAVNAAMAGCLPEYFPVVLAAFDAPDGRARRPRRRLAVHQRPRAHDAERTWVPAPSPAADG